MHRRAYELGAFGVVFKDQNADTLMRAIRTLHAGEAWLERVQAANLLNIIRRQRDPEEMKIESLTKREHEGIKLVGQGFNSAAISGCLFISEATVRSHLTSILGKLGLSNRFGLVVYAFRHRLVELQPEPVNPFGRDVVFTVQAGRTVSADTWEQFVARSQAEGRTVSDVLRDFIERYARGTTS